ncbi:MAG: DUF6017 domain-containing protein, partial [Bacteroidales bacterium]|nr:DUF6017 domain-containing protein [Bacteroidales bacterium]
MLENPTLGKPTLENPTQLNIDKTIKDKSNPDLLNTESYPIPSPFTSDAMTRRQTTPPDGIETETIELYREIIKKNTEYNCLVADSRFDRKALDEIIDLMLETVCTTEKTIRVAGDNYPAEFVRSKLLKLNSTHIEYVFECLKENTSEVRNIKKYL